MKKLIFIFSVFLFFSIAVYSQTPKTISFQGAATDIAGANLPDGDYMMIFKIYEDETGGSSIWSETQNVHVSGGIFNVVLGSVTPLDISFDRQYWLGVKVESDPELEPRIQFTASPYAFIASTVEDGAITEEKLAPGLTIPLGGTAGGDLTGEYPNPTIANEAVTTDKIKGKAVTSDKLAVNSVLTTRIADHAVTSDKLATNIHLGGLIALTESSVSCTSLANFDDAYQKLTDLVTFQKEESGSTIIATFYGRISAATITGTGAIFELRIDDTASTVSYARAEMKSSEAGEDGIRATISGTFDDLDLGSHTVSIWVKGIWGDGTNAMVDIGCWSTNKISVLEFE